MKDSIVKMMYIAKVSDRPRQSLMDSELAYLTKLRRIAGKGIKWSGIIIKVVAFVLTLQLLKMNRCSAK